MTYEKWQRENKDDVSKALREAKAGRYNDIHILFEECWNDGWKEGRILEKALGDKRKAKQYQCQGCDEPCFLSVEEGLDYKPECCPFEFSEVDWEEVTEQAKPAPKPKREVIPRT